MPDSPRPRSRRPWRTRLLVLVTVCVALTTGCVSQNQATDRAAGSTITVPEARVLADVLYQNLQKGGALVRVNAAFGEGALLTMEGNVDFVSQTGTVESTTTYSQSNQPDEDRVLYFTNSRMITGGIPGFSDAMVTAGREGVQYLRTDLDPATRLVDNIAHLIVSLRADAPDDPNNLIGANTTWVGVQRIDGVLANTFRTQTSTVSVGVEDQLMHQFVTVPPNNDFDITITLTEHGEQDIALPPEEEIADASAYPGVATQFGYGSTG